MIEFQEPMIAVQIFLSLFNLFLLALIIFVIIFFVKFLIKANKALDIWLAKNKKNSESNKETP